MNATVKQLNNLQIAATLRELARAKDQVKAIRATLVGQAVSVLGMDQTAAQNQQAIEVLLDGYLIGQGQMQSWRAAGKGESHD